MPHIVVLPVISKTPATEDRMAALIAHFTFRNREIKRRARLKTLILIFCNVQTGTFYRRCKNYPATKCMYTLPPFDKGPFDPMRHNRYLISRREAEEAEDEDREKHSDCLKK